jgi:hypothetical protein
VLGFLFDGSVYVDKPILAVFFRSKGHAVADKIPL